MYENVLHYSQAILPFHTAMANSVVNAVSALFSWLPLNAWLAVVTALAAAYFLLPKDKSLLDALIDLMPGRVSMMDYHLQLYKEYDGQK